MRRRKSRRAGQVVVEMLLILPIFLAMVFTIMEIGYVSFQLIVLNHATYEVARIGGMLWRNPGTTGNGKMNDFMKRILPAATVSCHEDPTPADPQAGNQATADLICTGTEDVKLIFPISSIILAKPKGTGTRRLQATVMMPIEEPLQQ